MARADGRNRSLPTGVRLPGTRPWPRSSSRRPGPDRRPTLLSSASPLPLARQPRRRGAPGSGAHDQSVAGRRGARCSTRRGDDDRDPSGMPATWQSAIVQLLRTH